jgi:hypothetical protein
MSLPQTPPGLLYSLLTFSVGSALTVGNMAPGRLGAVTLNHSLEAVYYAALGGLVSVAVKEALELVARSVKMRKGR